MDFEFASILALRFFSFPTYNSAEMNGAISFLIPFFRRWFRSINSKSIWNERKRFESQSIIKYGHSIRALGLVFVTVSFLECCESWIKNARWKSKIIISMISLVHILTHCTKSMNTVFHQTSNGTKRSKIPYLVYMVCWNVCRICNLPPSWF